MKIVALLPMKAHSERVPNKNFRDFCGKPLFRWVLDTLLSAVAIDQVVINTDAREKLATLFDELGACHLQIGKYYDYQGMITNEPLKGVLKGIKTMVDPEGKMNPGCLGLE